MNAKSTQTAAGKAEAARLAKLAKMRAAAYKAFDDHEADMKNDPAYKATADAQMARREAAAKKAGKK